MTREELLAMLLKKSSRKPASMAQAEKGKLVYASSDAPEEDKELVKKITSPEGAEIPIEIKEDEKKEESRDPSSIEHPGMMKMIQMIQGTKDQLKQDVANPYNDKKELNREDILQKFEQEELLKKLLKGKK